MALMASVVDGEVIDTTASSISLSSANETSSSSLDKDAFLQLLVAQMQYQDPLEPTSNTEYISQLATFSELEEMQNLSSSMDIQRACALVGQEVIMTVTSSVTGETTSIRGPVDYVTIESGNAYLSVNGSLYSIDDLDSVADATYLAAADKAYDYMLKMELLPTVANLTIEDREAIEEMWEEFDAMSDYELSFITTELQEMSVSYKEKMDELILLYGTDDESTEEESIEEVTDEEAIVEEVTDEEVTDEEV